MHISIHFHIVLYTHTHFSMHFSPEPRPTGPWLAFSLKEMPIDGKAHTGKYSITPIKKQALNYMRTTTNKQKQLTHNNNREKNPLADQPRIYHAPKRIDQFYSTLPINKGGENPDAKKSNVQRRRIEVF